MSPTDSPFRFWEELGSAVPLAVIATDATGIVKVWSSGAVDLYGWPEEETVGRPIQDLTVGPMERGIAQEIIDQVVRGEAWEGDFHARNRQGGLVEVHVLDLPIRGDAGETCGIVGISFKLDSDRMVSPVQDLLTLARQIRESRWRERTRLARVMHDEIGQLLAGARTEALDIAEGEGARKVPSSRLVDYLDLAITRLRKEVATLLEAEVDVWEMILRCYELTRDLQARAGMLVECHITGDPERFREVDDAVALAAFSTVRESLRNAERHSGAQHIEVRVVAEPDALVITVADDGRGLCGVRSGMGLKILRDSVEQLKGRLEVRSIEEIGLTGTVVSARIPMGGVINGESPGN